MKPQSSLDWLSWLEIEDRLTVLQTGDNAEGEFNALCREIGCLLEAFFRRKGLQSVDAESLAAESTEAVVLHLSRFETQGQGSFRAWCLRVATNRWKNWLRGRSNHRERTFGMESLDSLPAELPSEALVSRRSEAVSAALASLTDRDREIVLLHVVAGFEFPEIAASLNITAATARQAYHRAKVRLAKLLDDSRDG